jgi:hypothetical protein
MFLLDVVTGGREIPVRWEWDLHPPRAGTAVDIAARPGTLRFFESQEDDRPAVDVAGIALHVETTVPEQPTNVAPPPEPVAAPESAHPPRSGVTHAQAPTTPRHAGMPAID